MFYQSVNQSNKIHHHHGYTHLFDDVCMV